MRSQGRLPRTSKHKERTTVVHNTSTKVVKFFDFAIPGHPYKPPAWDAGLREGQAAKLVS